MLLGCKQQQSNGANKLLHHMGTVTFLHIVIILMLIVYMLRGFHVNILHIVRGAYVWVSGDIIANSI